MQRLYLTGYERENIDSFLLKLQRHGVRTVVDVREIPLSRKRGFSKTSLASALEEKNIRYLHYGKLGSPKMLRHKLRADSDYLHFFQNYRLHIRNQNGALRGLVDTISSDKHVALFCYENACELCHRSIVADEMQRIKPRLKVIPI